MRTKNYTYFDCELAGTKYEFRAHSSDTRNGFCHTVECLSHDITNTKVSYYNRTWETFQYESALSRAIDKFPKAIAKELHAILIDKKSREESERCDKFFNSFKSLHDGLSEENKKRLADSDIMINTESDAHAVMGLMGLMTLMQ